MGKHDSHRDFSGIGSTTGWVDASISFDCSNYANSPDGARSIDDPRDPSGGRQRSSYKIIITLDPATSVGGEGVIDVNSGSGSAKGVGLQLGFSDTLNANPLHPGHVWKKGVKLYFDSPSTTFSSLKIPLAARYYQKGSDITPGAANGKVMFTITYQ
ncbi:fimbrial protein [Aeromonas jandaei]|uniref:fimbrial protein n=1 Tax=Aeromonas jandaei TaxID=650 RepID=UPI003EC56346